MTLINEQDEMPRENMKAMRFAGLSELLKRSEAEEIPKGSYLVKEGQACKYIFYIEQGQLRTLYHKNGKDININFSFENDFVTDLKSFIYNIPSMYYIMASESAVIRRFTKDQLLSLHHQSREIEAFSRHLLQKLLITQEEHSNLFKIYTPSERYHYVAKYYPKLLQRVSLSQLSSYLGISRETISRIRRNTYTFSGI